MTSKTLPLAVACLAFCILCYAQGKTLPEYGSLSELAELKKVYVYADEYAVREMIVKELDKEARFEVVSKPEEADFYIGFGSSVFETGSVSFGGIFGGLGAVTTTRTAAEVGEFLVIRKGDRLPEGFYRPRILWAKQNIKVSRGNAFVKTKHPAGKIVREFLKDLKKAQKA